MLENRVVRYVAFGMSFIIISDLSLRLLYKISEKYKNWRIRVSTKKNSAIDEANDEEIADVFFVNEKTNSCLHRHMRSNMEFIDTSNNCDNSFCIYQNVCKLLGYIEKAQYTIDLAMYTCSIKLLTQSLIKARTQRGVKIRIITDKNMRLHFNEEMVKMYENGLVEIRTNKDSNLMHHKFCILDGEKSVARLNIDFENLKLRSILINGSVNWTLQGIVRNWENCMITSNKFFLESFGEEFERLWGVLDSI